MIFLVEFKYGKQVLLGAYLKWDDGYNKNENNLSEYLSKLIEI